MADFDLSGSQNPWTDFDETWHGWLCNVMSMWSLMWHFRNRSVTGAPYNIKVPVCHTAGHYGDEYDDWNSDVFKSRRNCSSDDAERTDGGRAFHARAAATGKARSPSVMRRVDGTTSVDVEALRRRRREPMSTPLDNFGEGSATWVVWANMWLVKSLSFFSSLRNCRLIPDCSDQRVSSGGLITQINSLSLAFNTFN